MASPYPIQISLVALARLSPTVPNNPHRQPEAPATSNHRVLENYTPRYQPQKSSLTPTRTPNLSLLAALKRSKNKPLLSMSAPLPPIFHSQDTLVDGRDRFWDVDLEGGQQPAAAVLPARSNDHEYMGMETEKEDARIQWLAMEKKLKRMDKGVIFGVVIVLCLVISIIAVLTILSRVLGPW